jgi:general secretion pathway protein C
MARFWGGIREGMRQEVEISPARLLVRMQRPTVYTLAELLLLLLIAVQAARLVWILLVPVGPVGDWKAAGALTAPADSSALVAFDPFFRLDGAAGPAVVTSLNLKLYGVREDRATGRGSAIIALPDGRQMDFAVGEEIMPGVTLTAVGFDNVTISRNGVAEQIFLDQSPPAQTIGAPETVAQAPAPVATPSVAAGQAINFQPRTAGGQVTGLIVAPGSDGGQAFRAAGFVAGDVIVAINGQRVSSLEQARAAMRRGDVTVMVDRGGQAVPLRVRVNW